MSSRTRRSQQERSAATRKRLLDATVECLVRYGYAGTTTTKVTELAGVTRGAQVHHFPTRADLVAAAVRQLAELRTEMAFGRIDAVRRAADPIDAALDLMWELHHGPVLYATVEIWVAARTDPELRQQLAVVEPAARVAMQRFAEAAFGEPGINPRFQRVLFTALDTVRGILLLSASVSDVAELNDRWMRAKADLRLLIDFALSPSVIT